MKSAGKCSSNCSVPSCGAWYWANGIEPESNHTSITSGTRCIGSPHSAHGNVGVVDERAVGIGEVGAREVVQLGQRADRVRVAVLAAPHRQRRAPVALARQGPVDVVLEPVAEAAVLDVLGIPVDRLVGGQQAVLDLAGGDVPGGLGVVEQRRAAAPAVRVGVLERLGPEEAAARPRGPRSGRGRRP